MTLARQHLNLDFNKFNKFINNSEKTKKISIYQNLCNSTSIHNEILGYSFDKLIKFIDEFYIKLSTTHNDINYYIEEIYSFNQIKFIDILNKLEIVQLISYLDYEHLNKNKSYYKIMYDAYNKLFYQKIIKSSYKLSKQKKFRSFYELFTDNYNNITINNLILFCQILNRLDYQNVDIYYYLDFIIYKFNDISNIKKLLSYILKEDNFESENINNKFKFIISNLKSNGYLLFEQYLISLKNNDNSWDKITIDNNLLLIKSFIKIISQKDNNNVNRSVNEILIKTRDYLYDLRDNYNNTMAFQKINIVNKFNKYSDETISNLNRNKCKFQILKYNNIENELLKNYILTDNLKIYHDLYESYYRSRYPDRNIEFDIIKSTIIVKMNFNSYNYFFHMALIQYMVMDVIMKFKDGISVTEISSSLGLSLSLLQDTFNSLLTVKLIKRTFMIDDTVDTIKFLLNTEFKNDTKKISITNLLNVQKKEEKIYEYLHDRNIIILSNIIDYGKKNKFFSEDVLLENISYKIPFKIDKQMFDNCIQDAVDKEFFEKVQMNNDILYKYIQH